MRSPPARAGHPQVMHLLTLPIRLPLRLAKGSLALGWRVAGAALGQVPGLRQAPGAERVPAPVPDPATMAGATGVAPTIPARTTPAPSGPQAQDDAPPAPASVRRRTTTTRTRRAPSTRRDDPSPKERKRATRREPTRGQAAELRSRARDAEARAGDDDPTPGANLRVAPPWEGYETTPVAEVVARLRDADPAVRAGARLFEQTHDRREEVLRATEDGA